MLRWIAAALVAIVLAGSYFSFTQHNDLLAARAAVQAAQTRGAAQLRVNELVLKYAAQQEAVADSAEAVVDTVIVRARVADVKLAAAPSVRDSLTAAVAGRDAYRSAFHTQMAASAALRSRGDSLARANRDLTDVVRDYGDASQAILDATKPSFLARLVPDVGVGAAVGIDPFTRKPSTAVGVTLSWSL